VKKIDLVGFEHTELGNAERIVAAHGADLRFCTPWKAWLIWDGRRWKRDATREVMRRAKATVRTFHEQAMSLEESEQRTAALRWALRSEAASTLAHAVELAASEPTAPVVPSDLDRDPYLVNVLNGTLDLRTGILRPHARADLLTKLAPVSYDPHARLDLWDRFLVETTNEDADLLVFLQGAVGYTLHGLTPDEVFFLVHGPEASGKSTFLAALRATLGDYAVTADFEAFLAKRGDGGIRNDIARLAGARLVLSIEVDEGKKLAQGMVKTITGGDTVTARFLHQEFFEFIPQFTLWLACNHAPKVNARDGALWRRVLRVPFLHTVPPSERDPLVKATLTNPALAGPAILRWAVEGFAKWSLEGLHVPSAVAKSTEAYRAENEDLADFLAERCIFQRDAWLSSKVLNETYLTWVKDTAAKRPHPLPARDFTAQLTERGCEAKKRSGVRGWLGIRLRTEADDDENADVDGVDGTGRQFGVFPHTRAREEKTGNCRPQVSTVSTERSPEEANPTASLPEAEPCVVCGLSSTAFSSSGESWCLGCWEARCTSA
jgi:putative DNA primase/helicase